MDIRVEKLGPTRRKIHVTVPGKTVKKEIDGIYLELKKSAKVKGFRPGKTPREILERYYGDYIREQAVSRIINNTYPGALSEGNIQPVSGPALENEALAEGEPFTYSAVVDVRPEVAVKDYTGLAVKGRDLKIEENEIAERLHQLQDLHARLELIKEDRPVQEGDFVVVDFQATIDGKPFEGGKGENVSIEVGGGRFLTDLEKGLVGLGPAEEKEIEVTFPEDHRERALGGKKAIFAVKIREIREKVLPPLDDEFAKDLGQESLEDLKEKIRGDLEAEKQVEINRSLENQILDQLIEKTPFDVPESMVQRRIDSLIRELKINLAYQGVEFERSNLDEGELRERYRDRAIKELKSDLILQRIGEIEKTEVTDHEVDKRYEEIGKRANQTPKQVEAYYRKNELVEGLKTQMMNEKTLQFLRSRAEITIQEGE
jgi:trigger factor